MLSFNWNNSQAVGGIGRLLLAVKLSWYLYACFVKVILFIKGKTREFGTRGMAARKRTGLIRRRSWGGGRWLRAHSSSFWRWFCMCDSTARVLEDAHFTIQRFYGSQFPSSAHRASEKLSAHPRDGSGDSPRQASPRPCSINVATTSGRGPDASLRRLPSLTSSRNRSRLFLQGFSFACRENSQIYPFFPFLYNYPSAFYRYRLQDLLTKKAVSRSKRFLHPPFHLLEMKHFVEPFLFLFT